MQLISLVHIARVFGITSQWLSSPDLSAEDTNAFGSSPAETGGVVVSILGGGKICSLLMLPAGQAARAPSPTLTRPASSHNPCALMTGVCQRHSPPGELGSPAQPKIDLGHPFATSARIAHRLPVGGSGPD